MKKIVNWAHRGASGHAPENTRAAFEKGLTMGADGIECDLQESRDGVLVVFHDPTIQRLTGKEGRVEALPLSELSRLDIGSWFSPSFAGEKIVTADALVSMIPPPFLLNLEIKRAAPRRIIDLIEKRGISDRTIVSSFNHPLLKEIRHLHSTLSLGYLVDREPWEEVFREAAALRAVSLHLSARRVTTKVIERAHQEGFDLYVYTVNEPARMRSLIERGVDGLFTNYPDRLVEVISQKS
ncbi:MAG: glycerophosphodiester phosphodiesterase family protein [Candidatus Manganitrophaceae bacterium]